MKKGTTYWLRWIAVIPGSPLAALVVSTIIPTVLYYTLLQVHDFVPSYGAGAEEEVRRET